MNMYTIYGTPTCGYCKEAMELLDRNDLGYYYKDLTEGYIEEYKRLFPGKTSVPQITLDGHYIGGHDDLVQHLKDIS